MFERFYRADPSRSRGKGGGSGLGPGDRRAIVAAHHGRVGVAQTPGGGATFVVELPQVTPSQRSAALTSTRLTGTSQPDADPKDSHADASETAHNDAPQLARPQWRHHDRAPQDEP